VVYLVIIVLIAAAGLGRLWWIQRRHTTSLSSVEGFRSSLERLADQQLASPVSGTSGPPPQPDADESAARPVAWDRSQQRAERESSRIAGGSSPTSGAAASRAAAAASSLNAASAGQDRGASDPYLEPLDPERRAAAKRRLEARRRGVTRDGLGSR
jgi:hypothetical protein